jgi:hypothetical protein
MIVEMLADIIFNRLEECGTFLAPGQIFPPFTPRSVVQFDR